MRYQQLGEVIYIPTIKGHPLNGRKHVKFNYYLSTYINGSKIDMDITTKIFDEDQIFIRKACCRVSIGNIENCVKKNLIDHMLTLGLKKEDIPKSLICKDTSAFMSKI